MAVRNWYRRRSYAHFDRPRSESEARELVTRPELVARHGFWPLILAPKRIVSRKLDENTGERRFSEKRRPIGFCAHTDAHIYAYYAHLLGEKLEDHYSRNGGEYALAYRSFGDRRCNVHFASEAFDEIRQRGNCDVVAIDVEGFFDCLDHALLKCQWEKILGVTRLPEDHFRVFRACTRDTAILKSTLRDIFGGEVRRRTGKDSGRICSSVDFRDKVTPWLRPRHELVWEIKGKVRPPGISNGPLGIPQGLPISAVLANLYMVDADARIVQRIRALGGSYRRYSDDILLILPHGNGARGEEIVRGELESVHLALSEKKTERVRLVSTAGELSSFALDDQYERVGAGPARYLGLTFDGKSVRLRDSTISNFTKKASKAIRRAVLAARRVGETKLRRRQLRARLTSVGYGRAYGSFAYGSQPSNAPRLGFFKYVRLAERVSGSSAIVKQRRQLDALIFRWLNEADKELASLR